MSNVRSVFHRGIDYNGYYTVNDIGVVSSLDRVDCAGRHLKGKVLKQIVAPNGYVQVALSINGKPRTARVHEIVARAFPEICGEWFEGCEVDHIDADKTNNKATNLRVVTHAMNMRNPNTIWKKQGENHPMYGRTLDQTAKDKISKAHKGRKFSDEHIQHLRENHHKSSVSIYSFDGSLIGKFESVKEAAKYMNTSESIIRKHSKNRGVYKRKFYTEYN